VKPNPNTSLYVFFLISFFPFLKFGHWTQKQKATKTPCTLINTFIISIINTTSVGVYCHQPIWKMNRVFLRSPIWNVWSGTVEPELSKRINTPGLPSCSFFVEMLGLLDF
jgi:hypothetical protein